MKGKNTMINKNNYKDKRDNSIEMIRTLKSKAYEIIDEEFYSYRELTIYDPLTWFAIAFITNYVLDVLEVSKYDDQI